MSNRSDKKQRIIRYGSVSSVAAIVLMAAATLIYSWISVSQDAYTGATAEARFFDVGQGDAAIFLWDEGAILIDSGTNSSEETLVEYINRLRIDKIDLAVFTHPHEDHIGGADKVLEAFDIRSVLMPDASANSMTYTSMMECVKEEGCPVYEASAGGEYSFGDVTLTVLSPTREYGDLNLDSAVVMIKYGDVSFLFMGDCEREAELEALEMMGVDAFDCDVIKVGHHGSYTSTSDELLSAATPDIAVISCGENNEYGHPHRETVSKLDAHGVDTYRTDEEGTVIICTDGVSFWYKKR